ncbi:MAG: S-layer homology domain-containing protein [Pseudoflavonifractor sp.]|nr:S-layer homology domain-containing protein [Pseudoflavonifractor sp.]
MYKRILALTLSVVLALSLTTLPAAAATTGDVDEAVAVLTGLGIVSGCSDGLYHPGDGLTRAQFCKLAVLAEGHGDQVAGSAYRALFSDVPGESWAASYINLAYEEGLVAGKGNGTFGPDETVTLAQAVTVSLRLLGYTDDNIGPFWPEDYLSKASKLGLLDGLSASGNDALTRGQAALLLYNLLQQPDSDGDTFALGLGVSSVENAILLDNNDEAEDGTLHTAYVYAKEKLTWYEQATAISDSLVHRRGTLLLNKTGKVCGFLPDDSTLKTAQAETVTASTVTDTNGNRYTISGSTPVVADDEMTAYSSVWYEMEGRTLTFYYAESGGITLVTASDTETYDGTLLTGYYEAANPNASDPNTVTLLGHTFDVADGASGLSGLAVGDKITIALNGSGEVIRAWASSEKRTDVVAVLNSASKGTFTHVSGLSLSAEISNTSTASSLEGCLVRVSASEIGKCSVSALSGGVSGKLNVAARTLGTVSLSENVKIYDQVSSAPAVEIELSDILTETVSANEITYAGTNASGEVDIILLNNVTGDAYTYGIYRVSKVTGGTKGSDDYYEYKTLALESAEGTSAYCATIDTVRSDTVGGLAVTADKKIAGLASVTKVADVFRSAFDGKDAVVLNDVRVPIASDVQVYNDDSDQWITLAEAKGYSETLTVYYSGTLGGDAKVRVIVTSG